MGGRNRFETASASSSSFASELFGPKDSASSTGIFWSIFAPSSKVIEREPLQPEVTAKKPNSGNESWKAKPEVQDGTNNKSEGSRSKLNIDFNSIYQDQRVQPCHLSSSIYYGGQDIYSYPESQKSQWSSFKKDTEEDDSGSASRGNWWKGSLYY